MTTKTKESVMNKKTEDKNIFGAAKVHWNLSTPALYEQSLSRGETHIVQGGPLLAMRRRAVRCRA